MGLVTGVVAPAVDDIAVGDDDSPAEVSTVGDVVDDKGTVGFGASTGTDEFPHATVPSTMEVAMDTNATR